MSDTLARTLLEVVTARRSTGRLHPPGPTADELATILQAAEAAPDHGRLRPWRFHVLEGAEKDAFGQVLAGAYRRRCAEAGTQPEPAKEAKEATKLGRAPTVVVVGCVTVEGRIPAIEQFAATAAATQNMLLAATALGYGSMWRTGDPVYDHDVKAAVGLSPDDHIVAFVYLGSTERTAAPTAPPPVPSDAAELSATAKARATAVRANPTLSDHDTPSAENRPVGRFGAELPRASGADAARTIVAGATRGTLSTISVDPAGFPYGSLVSYGLDEAGNPLMVISGLAEHTRNAMADGRAGMLVAEDAPEGMDPLAMGRVSLLGSLEQVPEAEQADAVATVVAAVPSVAGYAGFGDFSAWRLRVEAVRWIGGFGSMSWIGGDDYRQGTLDGVLPHRMRIIEHMNDDHADSGVLLCSRATGGAAISGATMVGVDRFGCDYVAQTPEGQLVIRLPFDPVATSSAEVQAALVAMVRAAEGA